MSLYKIDEEMMIGIEIVIVVVLMIFDVFDVRGSVDDSVGGFNCADAIINQHSKQLSTALLILM